MYEWVEELDRKFGQQVEFALGKLLGPSGVEGSGGGGDVGEGNLRAGFLPRPHLREVMGPLSLSPCYLSP